MSRLVGPGQHRRMLAAEPRGGRRDGTSIRSALAVGVLAAAVVVAVAAPFMSRYGWDRDELYFLAAAHHPALGYVDFPPLIAWIGWVVQRLDADSLVALRATSLASGAATVVLTALMARSLGGGVSAQAIAALAWAFTPYILGSGSIFHPTWLDALAWVALLYAATGRLAGEEELRPRRLLYARRRPHREWGPWLLIGVIAGVGLEAKYTIAVLMLALVLALMLSPQRGLLLTPGPWLALSVAVILIAPNLLWQASHGWVSVRFFSSQNAATAASTSRPAYVAEQLLFLGAASVIACIGVLSLWRRGQRALALVPVVVTVAFLLERGRSYYPLPADSLAIAAGAVALERWPLRGRRLLLLPALLLVQLADVALAGPIVVPFYSTRQMVQTPRVWKTGFFKDEIGWREMTVQVERAWSALPRRERGVVLTRNYGEAGALRLYGRGLGPVLSGHLSFQYWRPARLPQRYALTVGYDAPSLDRICRRWRPVARIENRWQLGNEERGRLIAACSLQAPLGRLWKRFIATDQL